MASCFRTVAAELPTLSIARTSSCCVTPRSSSHAAEIGELLQQGPKKWEITVLCIFASAVPAEGTRLAVHPRLFKPSVNAASSAPGGCRVR